MIRARIRPARLDALVRRYQQRGLHRGLATKRNQLGLTLIELMIALVVSTIIVGFFFGIHTRMSVAYKSQQGISQTLQTLRAARQMLQRDLRMAGYLIPDGVLGVPQTLNASRSWPALTVFNDKDGFGADGFRVIYATPNVVSRIESHDLPNNSLTVEDASAFALGAPVMLIASGVACAIQVSAITGNTLSFDTGGTQWNESPDNPHCAGVATQINLGVESYLHGLTVQSYRIDPSRLSAAVLQLSPSGELIANDWRDLGVGFTNLQLASRYLETGDLADSDGDGDPEREWYSGENQETPDPLGVRPPTARITDVTLSVEVRSSQSINSVGASATPAFTVIGNVNNNRLGDWGGACTGNPSMDPCGIDLLNTPDASRPVQYQGVSIYRWSTTLVDLRNMGVGF